MISTSPPQLALIGDDETDEKGGFQTLKIRWKPGSNVPTIRGTWKRLADGKIEAIYTRDELKKCLEICDLLAEPS
jgi:hypothetical protein